jgi:DNA-binding XRE family transcriptional regulator
MKTKREPLQWTAEDKARHAAVRRRFDREKPALEKLIASGEYGEPVLGVMYFRLRNIIAKLREVRQSARLSLDDIATRSGIGKAALSRLENGRQLNPTLNTLYRYATAVGRELAIDLGEIPQTNPVPKRRASRQVLMKSE